MLQNLRSRYGVLDLESTLNEFTEDDAVVNQQRRRLALAARALLIDYRVVLLNYNASSSTRTAEDQATFDKVNAALGDGN